MYPFVIGWVVSTFWTIFLVPVFLVKKAFAIPFDEH